MAEKKKKTAADVAAVKQGMLDSERALFVKLGAEYQELAKLTQEKNSARVQCAKRIGELEAALAALNEVTA